MLPVLGAGDLRRVAAPGCQASPEPWARARPISMSTHAARCLTRPCRRRRSCRGGVNRRGDLHSCCSRWRMSSSVTYGSTDIAATTGHLATGMRARASALTRTTSGSRGSGGRSSAQGCSRRAPRLVGTDSLHCLSSPRPVSARARLMGTPCSSSDRFLQERYERARGWASPESARVGGIFRVRPMAPRCLRGLLPVDD